VAVSPAAGQQSGQQAGQPGAHQSDQQTIIERVTSLFDAMRTGDTASMRAMFAPQARMLGLDRQGELRSDPIDGWLASVGRAAPGTILDERTSDYDVRTDGDIAQAWMKYVFYVGERLSHCGHNAFEFVRVKGTWLIVSVMDTRRTEGCATPAS